MRHTDRDMHAPFGEDKSRLVPPVAAFGDPKRSCRICLEAETPFPCSRSCTETPWLQQLTAQARGGLTPSLTPAAGTKSTPATPPAAGTFSLQHTCTWDRTRLRRGKERFQKRTGQTAVLRCRAQPHKCMEQPLLHPALSALVCSSWLPLPCMSPHGVVWVCPAPIPACVLAHSCRRCKAQADLPGSGTCGFWYYECIPGLDQEVDG